ncbi:MAG: MlaD family protein [Firmicutes bacterium]|nr:MlaD family protein [Bacillota bacterium]
MKLESKVGAFFIGTLLIFGLLALRTEKLEFLGRATERTFRTEFAQVAGLNVQGHIRIAGVKVGSVKDISLEGHHAVVTFSVENRYAVRQGAVASLSSIGILGEKYIELDPGTGGGTDLPTGSTIPSKTGISLDNLMETLGAIGTDVKGITYALNQSIGGEKGRQKLDEIVDNIRSLTGEFRAMAQENHAAINNTMANVESISSELRDRLPKIAKQFEDLGKTLNGMVDENRPELKGMVADVRKLAQGFQSTSENIRSITEKMNKGEGTIGKLLNDESTVKKLNEAVDNVNQMLSGFRTMDLRLDMGAARWTSRNDSSVGLGIELAPRKDYWYYLAVNSTPDGKITENTRTITQIDPVTGLPTNTLEKTRTINSEQVVTLSAEFMKRLGDHLVVHAGFIDGKGGAGAELRFLDDRLRFGGLAYDFSKRPDKPNPRYRITSSYQFWKGLYVQAGVQDVGNKDFRTAYVGGGVRWSDEDLKKLVGLAGAAK